MTIHQDHKGRPVPVDDGGAHVTHSKAGCHMPAGAQFDDVGRYTWFIAGP